VNRLLQVDRRKGPFSLTPAGSFYELEEDVLDDVLGVAGQPGGAMPSDGRDDSPPERLDILGKEDPLASRIVADYCSRFWGAVCHGELMPGIGG
jgi:hypothetical protein